MENNQYAYLVKVEPNANNNKYYKMIQLNDSTFEVQYGRIGNSNYQKSSYPMYQWDKKFKEKIKKGYIDQTRLVAEVTVENKTNEYLEIKDVSVRNIVSRLQAMAKQAIRDNYTVSSTNVTQAMVDEAQLILNKLMSDNSIDKFNKVLVELFQVIPRKMSRVSDYLAKTINNFADIIQREQDLLDVMKGQVKQQDLVKESNIETEDELPTQTILEAMGLKIENITQEDEDIIKFNLGSISDKFYQGWKVVNVRTQEKYDNFIKENKIKDNRLLFHGSRNENWWSIINNGLVLRPSAVITGKMFGYGIYFAPNPKKSLGYTSLDGSYWASGNSKSAFMGLYNVAYGKPYDVYSFESEYHSLNYEKLQQRCKDANSLHAHADRGMLKNDEIVVYKEEQLTIKYLIELK